MAAETHTVHVNPGGTKRRVTPREQRLQSAALQARKRAQPVNHKCIYAAVHTCTKTLSHTLSVLSGIAAFFFPLPARVLKRLSSG